MRAPWLRVTTALPCVLVISACGAPDAGTYCEQDYHCISGSCTFHSCDAFPSCWPNCDDDEDKPEESSPAPPRRSLDAAVCTPLKLCSELTLSECDRELGCQRIPSCTTDARVPDPLRLPSLFSDGGVPTRCAPSGRCGSTTASDFRIHPFSAPLCI